MSLSSFFQRLLRRGPAVQAPAAESLPPSQADIEMTRRLIAAGEPLGIVVHDHVVIGKGRHASFRSLGLI